MTPTSPWPEFWRNLQILNCTIGEGVGLFLLVGGLFRDRFDVAMVGGFFGVMALLGQIELRLRP